MRPFLPPLLPLEASRDRWGNFGNVLSMALSSLGRFSGMMENSPKSDPFWFVWLLKESQVSNEIEGTITTIDEVLENNAGLLIPPERRGDVTEVVNYRVAMQKGGDAIRAGHPFSLTLIRGLHAELLQGARGQNKDPGNWRKIQVHIGKRGEPIEKAFYVPPPPEYVPSLLDNLIAFTRRTDLDILIQTAILHAQFEMIHPFLDGNGRLGRLLISLFMVSKGLMTKPQFYLSTYLNEHRDQYYNLLSGISVKNDWSSWIEFFIDAVYNRSINNIQILNDINSLYDKLKATLHSITSSSYALQIIEYAFSYPIFTIPKMSNAIGITKQVAHPIIKKLGDAGIFFMYKKGAGRQAPTWAFAPLIELLRK